MLVQVWGSDAYKDATSADTSQQDSDSDCDSGFSDFSDDTQEHSIAATTAYSDDSSTSSLITH